MQTMKVAGLALATSISALVNTIILTWLLRRQMGGLDGARILRSVMKLAPPTAGLGLVCWAVMVGCEQHVGTTGLAARFIGLLLPISLGTLVFIGAAALMKVEEMQSAWRLVRRRFTSPRAQEPEQDLEASDGL